MERAESRALQRTRDKKGGREQSKSSFRIIHAARENGWNRRHANSCIVRVGKYYEPIVLYNSQGLEFGNKDPIDSS